MFPGQTSSCPDSRLFACQLNVYGLSICVLVHPTNRYHGPRPAPPDACRYRDGQPVQPDDGQHDGLHGYGASQPIGRPVFFGSDAAPPSGSGRHGGGGAWEARVVVAPSSSAPSRQTTSSKRFAATRLTPSCSSLHTSTSLAIQR